MNICGLLKSTHKEAKRPESSHDNGQDIVIGGGLVCKRKCLSLSVCPPVTSLSFKGMADIGHGK